MLLRIFHSLSPAVWLLALAPVSIPAAELATVDNFPRAETDVTMGLYVQQGALGRFLNIREPTPIDKQNVIRMNRDTIYSFAVFDLTEPVTVIKPESEGRFQSMQVLDQDQYTLAVHYAPGEYTFTKEQIGTPYFCLIIRTFVDARDPADILAANQLQDKLVARQLSAGIFQVPEWDAASLEKVRDAANILAATRTNARGMFGGREQVDSLNHLLGAAYGWGGLPDQDATYLNVVPEKNDSVTPYSLTVPADVPVEGFWSVTVYNAQGFMQENDLNAYSVNNVTAAKNPDGTVTIHFGGDSSASNYLPITPGWSYIVRLYRPKPDILEGKWEFADAVSAW